MDPDYYDDDDEGFEAGEEYVYDTFDQIIDESVFDEVDPDRDDNYDWDINGAEMGLMGALASEMCEEHKYSVDENTDKENWERAIMTNPLSSRHQVGSNLQPFERYVQDYIKRGFRHPDD